MKCYTRLLLVLLLPGQIDGVYAHNQLESPSKVVVSDLRCEYLTDPLGIDTPHPRFSWKLLDPGKTHGQKQTAYQLVVEDDIGDETKGREVLWDSGIVESSSSVNKLYAGVALKSNQNCYWRVRIWDKSGACTEWSSTARFSMGLLNDSDWHGGWIRYEEADNIKHIWYRKRFTLKRPPRRAFVHLASIGYHELYVNGRRVGTRVLSPEVTNLKKRVSYVTYDIAELLKTRRQRMARSKSSATLILT